MLHLAQVEKGKKFLGQIALRLLACQEPGQYLDYSWGKKMFSLL